MRQPNPLREILESSMLQAEPMLDTEWPAGDVVLSQPVVPERAPAYAPRVSVSRLR
jgi:hypothetical protein